ncbi:DUF4381 domain-containing protein [Pseudomonas sp. LABIM340]|uniref:DUF4381 domain-containing protein n=1 Tax=Pseudomonas sp. LABIM340 TaxID=3156585 RepID=UPI0032AFE7A4
MSSVAPDLRQLQELPLPPLPSYWPPAWGWWVLLMALIVVAALLGLRRYQRWRSQQYRREALAQLDLLTQQAPEQRRELAALLKRCALSIPALRNRRAEITTLNGPAWQAFLQRHCPRPLASDLAERLAQLAYVPAAQLQRWPQADWDALFAQARLWLEAHRVAA